MGNISGMAGVSFGLAATIGSMDWNASQYVQLAAVLVYVENKPPASPDQASWQRLADPGSCPRHLLALFKPARGSSGRTLPQEQALPCIGPASHRRRGVRAVGRRLRAVRHTGLKPRTKPSITGLLLTLCASPWTGAVRAHVVSFLWALGVNELLVGAIKKYCGYWRPYYYAECAADLVGGAGGGCMGDALRSFPSGQSTSRHG